MLSYIVKTTTSLCMMSVILGVITAYTRKKGTALEKRIVVIGACIGLIGSVIMAVFKNTTSRIDTGYWNLGIFSVSLVSFLLFLIFSLKKMSGKRIAGLSWICLSIITAMIIFYTLPDVWAYPYQMVSAGQSMVSTDFLYKMIGLMFGWILNIVLYFAVAFCALSVSEEGCLLMLRLVLLVSALRQLSVTLQIMLAKRIVKSNHILFLIAKHTSNGSDWFIYLTLLIPFVLTLILWYQSLHVNEAYRNPAEHRKIRAKWRSIRRWAGTAIITFVLCIFNMTAVKAFDSRVVELSPVEDAEIRDGNVYVPFEQVNDGHLHRFAYETERGTQIRFIVIQKPNSSSYGIGLDACDICGETGYYEKDGQVVCKLCDVVMNINTIGFKGGCNPIVIPYEIADGQIIVPIDGLLEYEAEFK